MATNKLTQALLDDFVEDADSGFEVCVVWRPSESNPVTCNHLRVNNRVIAVDQEFRNSPVAHQVEQSDDEDFVVDWSITPEVPLDGIVIGIINWQTKAKVVVASQTKLKPGVAWAGQQVVDAP